VGDILHQIDARKATEIRAIFQADVVVRQTDFEYPYESSEDYPAMLTALARDQERNRLIADDVSHEITEGAGAPLLVLTQDESQDDTLKEMLDKEGVSSVSLDPVLIGKGEKGLDQQLQSKNIQVVLANRQIFQKMISETKFEALFLTTPFNFRGKIIDWFQGMLRRNNGQQLIKLYDYVDSKVSILDNFFRMRSYAYGLRLPSATLPK